MGYRVKVEHIRGSRGVDGWYLFLPKDIARSLGLQEGDEFEWTLEDPQRLLARRASSEPPAREKGGAR